MKEFLRMPLGVMRGRLCGNAPNKLARWKADIFQAYYYNFYGCGPSNKAKLFVWVIFVMKVCPITLSCDESLRVLLCKVTSVSKPDIFCIREAQSCPVSGSRTHETYCQWWLRMPPSPFLLICTAFTSARVIGFSIVIGGKRWRYRRMLFGDPQARCC